RDQNIDLECCKFSRLADESLGLFVREPMLQPHGSTVDIAERLQTVDEGAEVDCLLFSASGVPKDANSGGRRSGLRLGSEGCREDAPTHDGEESSPVDH